MTKLFIAILLLSSLAIAQVIEGPYYYDNHTYYLLENATWEDSNDTAIAMGGYLTAVNSEEENMWLVSQFSPNQNRYLWTGFNDLAQEGVWVWTSGEEVTYTNWANGQPDDAHGGQDYAYIIASPTKDKWNVLEWDDESNWPWQYPDLIHGVVEINEYKLETNSWGSIKSTFI